MKTSSAKNKGRSLQKYVVNKLRDLLKAVPDLDVENDITSRSMGAQGTDVLISNRIREWGLNYDIECKNQEKINIWESYKQAETNKNNGEPLLIIKRNRSKVLVIMDFDYFLGMHK